MRTHFPGLKKSKLSGLTSNIFSSSSKSEEDKEEPKSTSVGFIPLTSKNSNGDAPSTVPDTSKSSPDEKQDKTESNQTATLRETGDTSTSSPAKSSSPKKDDSAFVFGQNLSDRAENFNVTEEGQADPNNDPGDQPAKEAENDTPRSKTLTESAAEYCESHAQKRKYEEVKPVTGEENEVNVVQINAKLHVFEKNNSSWTERGRGILRLNDVNHGEDEANISSRLVMRTSGVLRVILNTPLFPGMSVEKPSEKTIRLTGTDEGEVKIFLISAAPRDIQDLYSAMLSRQRNSQPDEPPAKKPTS